MIHTPVFYILDKRPDIFYWSSTLMFLLCGITAVLGRFNIELHLISPNCKVVINKRGLN